jgi:hypothetical protein
MAGEAVDRRAVLPVQLGGQTAPRREIPATWVPSGDQRGAVEANEGNSGRTLLPSGFIV